MYPCSRFHEPNPAYDCVNEINQTSIPDTHMQAIVHTAIFDKCDYMEELNFPSPFQRVY